MTRDLRMLRLTLIRELETINEYQESFEAAEDPAIRELLGHLMYEEKEHVAELTEMLKRHDADQAAHFAGAHAAAIGSRERSGGSPGSPATSRPAEAPADPGPGSPPGNPEEGPRPADPDTLPGQAGSGDELRAGPPPPATRPTPEDLTVGSLLGVPQE